MKKRILYPIKFDAILKYKLWGGNKLKTIYNKTSDLDKIGESWELSGVKGSVSIVSNGFLKGQSIIDLIKTYKSDFLGNRVYERYGREFPLLFKFIDASDDLSIQLHPNDAVAKKKHQSFGKTEMWYVLDADNNSKIYAGLKESYDQYSFLENFKSNRILNTIREEKVDKGDVFFIEAGTIHAVGGGVVIAEIQQTSDVTYRLYDWDRLDQNGNHRELHIDLALEAIDYTKNTSCKVIYKEFENKPNKILSCSYFTTKKWILTKNVSRDLSTIDSFIVYMCLDGRVKLTVGDIEEFLDKGESVLIPALAERIFFEPMGKSVLIEVYI